MVKTLGDANSRRRRAREDGVDSGTIGEGQWRCKFKRIQSETTVRRHMGRTFL